MHNTTCVLYRPRIMVASPTRSRSRGSHTPYPEDRPSAAPPRNPTTRTDAFECHWFALRSSHDYRSRRGRRRAHVRCRRSPGSGRSHRVARFDPRARAFHHRQKDATEHREAWSRTIAACTRARVRTAPQRKSKYGRLNRPGRDEAAWSRINGARRRCRRTPGAATVPPQHGRA